MNLSKTFQQETKWFLAEVARFAFYISLATWFILFIINRRINGFISDYVNLGWILGLSLIFGLGSVFWGERERDKDNRWFVIELSKSIFPIVLITYLIYFLFEDFLPGLISDHLSLNWILVICAITGFLSLFTKEEKEKKTALTKKDYIFIIILAILGTLLIWQKIKELGWLSWVIAVISGVLIVIISLLLLEEDEEEN